MDYNLIYDINPWYSDEAEEILKNGHYRKQAEAVMGFMQTYFPLHFPSKEPKVHIEMLMLSMFGSPNTCLAVPRGHSKSTLLSFGLAIYYIVFMEYKYIVIASESLEKAQQFVQRIRDELEFNHELIKDFAPSGFKTTDWAKSEFVTKTRVKVEAIGYGQSGRGLIFENSRPDLVIYDDLETTENAGDQKMKDKFDTDLYPAIARSNPKHKRIYVGTIINDTALLADTLKDTRWVSARYEATKDNTIDVSDLKDKHMLAPMLYPTELYKQDRLASERKGKMSLFMAETHNNPTIKDENAVFLRETFTYYNYDNIRKHMDSMNIYTSIDPAISKSERADYTVITTIAVNSDNVWFILNQEWGRWNNHETVEKIFSQSRLYKPMRIIFETIAYQQALKIDFEREMERRNSFFRIDTAKKQNKEMKIQQLEPRYKARLIKHPEGNTSFVPALESQLLGFRPELRNFGLQHDDMIDSLSMLCDFAEPPTDYSSNSEEYIGYEEEDLFDSYIIN